MELIDLMFFFLRNYEGLFNSFLTYFYNNTFLIFIKLYCQYQAIKGNEYCSIDTKNAGVSQPPYPRAHPTSAHFHHWKNGSRKWSKRHTKFKRFWYCTAQQYNLIFLYKAGQESDKAKRYIMPFVCSTTMSPIRLQHIFQFYNPLFPNCPNSTLEYIV